MDYFLAIDIGTTSTKAIAFSETGEIILQEFNGYDTDRPDQDRSEQDPEEIFAAVINGINKVTAALAPAKPLFVSFSSAMHSLICIDAEGNPLTRCIIWADNRANVIADNLKSTETGRNFYKATGVPIHAMSPLCKILWFKENEPQIFSKTSKFIGIKEFVFYKLFKTYWVDSSIASATGLLNINTLQWEPGILDFIGITEHALSEVVSASHVLYYEGLHTKLNITQRVPFVIGASDGALSNLGAGATGDNAMAITIGTSGAARMLISHVETDPQMRTFCYHLHNNQYIVGGAINNGAVVIQWLKETLLQTEEDYNQIFKHAEPIAAGSDELIFLPYLLGERAPLWDSNAKGVYFGLGIKHTKGHLIRASIEGIIFSLYSIGRILAEKRNIKEIHASGGFAENPLGLQVLADVFNSTVVVSGAVQSSALGAVMIGAEALGIATTFKKSISQVYQTNSENNKVYRKKFEKFERLYSLLKAEMLDA